MGEKISVLTKLERYLFDISSSLFPTFSKLLSKAFTFYGDDMQRQSPPGSKTHQKCRCSCR